MYKYLKQVFLLSLLIHNVFPDCQCGLRRKFERALIHGGKDAQPGEYPWQVFIQTLQIIVFENGTLGITERTCGGSIINNEWILTAAHCLPSWSTSSNEGVQPGILVGVGRVSNADLDLQPWINYWFYLGPRPEMSTLSENGLYLVDRLVSHKEYTHTNSADIGLLHVHTPFNFSDTVRPVCLETSTSGRNFYPMVEFSGWGKTWAMDTDNHRLQSAQVHQVKDQNCARYGYPFVPARQMCFNGGSPGGCKGDSGSPCVVRKSGRFHQIAIVSTEYGNEWILRCSDMNLERVGISVAYFHNWIKKMANSGTCSVLKSSCPVCS